MVMEKDVKRTPWYFTSSFFIVAFLCIGPFALPIVWFNPRYNKKTKAVISIIVIAVSFLLGLVLANSLRAISQYYSLIFSS